MKNTRVTVSICIALSIFLLSIGIVLSRPDPSSKSKCKKKEYFHNETQTCYRERTPGPCTGNMVFFKWEWDSIYGECDCREDTPLPWVYHPESGNCFESYKQAYCPTGQWLTFDNDLKPVCTPNICKDSILEDAGNHPGVILKEKCVQLHKPSELCNPAEEVGFNGVNVVPECLGTLQGQTVTSTKNLRCRPGTKRDLNGICRKTATIVMDD